MPKFISLGRVLYQVVTTLCVLSFSLSVHAQVADVAFINVNVVPMDSERIVPTQTVLVHNGRITAVGPVDAIAVPEDAIVIDGAGRYLIPGLADMHVHLDKKNMRAKADFAEAALFLANGITTVLNLRGESYHLDWRQRVKDGQLLAPTLYTSGDFINEPLVNTPDEVGREVKRQVDAGYDVIKFHEVYDSQTKKYATTRGLSPAAYVRLNETARRMGIPLIGHAPNNLGLEAALAQKQSLAHSSMFYLSYFYPTMTPQFRFHQRSTKWGIRLILIGAIGCGGFIIGWAVVAFIQRRRAGAVSRFPWHVTFAGGMGFAIFFLSRRLYQTLMSPMAPWIGDSGVIAQLTGIGVGVVVATVGLILLSVQAWRNRTTAMWMRVYVVLVTVVALLCAFSQTYWLPLIWRSSDRGLDAIAAKTQEAGIWVTANLVVNTPGKFVEQPALKYISDEMRQIWKSSYVPPERVPEAWRKTGQRLEVFYQKLTHALHQAGVPLLLGTDAMGSTYMLPGVTAHEELCLLVLSGLTPYQALRTATVEAANFLGMENKFGTVTPGKRADLLLIADNPLEDIAHARRSLGVMARGRWLPAVQLDTMLSTLALLSGDYPQNLEINATTLELLFDTYETAQEPERRTLYAGMLVYYLHEAGQAEKLMQLAPGSFVREAESADVITGAVEVADDESASGGRFIWVKEGGRSYEPTSDEGGEAIFTINIPESGEYKIIAGVSADSGSNSFFVKFDEHDDYEIWEPSIQPKWNWQVLTIRPSSRSAVFPLSAGEHQFKLRAREDGTRVDVLVFYRL